MAAGVGSVVVAADMADRVVRDEKELQSQRKWKKKRSSRFDLFKDTHSTEGRRAGSGGAPQWRT